MKRIILWLWFGCFFYLPLLRATHIVGGEMNYTCLGNNRYEITLTIFRDCFFGDPRAWFDNPASIGVFDVNNRLLGQVLVPLMNNDTLNPVLSGECFVVPPSVCVHTTTYRTVVTLPFRAGGYQLAYQRCCRNQTILNIINPLASGATYGVVISERALRECNSSPQFRSWPPIYICVNEPIRFDQSAIDADGDSIVYRLCDPLLGASPASPQPQPPNAPPYRPVNWRSPPYGVDNMLNAAPDGELLRIDPVTGLLTGVPNTVGQFVVGICIEEYRNGELISTTRRDFQYNVGICGKPIAGFFAPETQCGDLTVQFENTSLETNRFLWQFGDGRTSEERNPSFTFRDTGRYLVRLIIEPGTTCADTFEQAIQLLPNTLRPNFSFDFQQCTDSLTVTVLDASADPAGTITTWQWLLQPLGLRSEMQTPIFNIGQSGNFEVELRLEADNGCTATLSKPLEIKLLEVDLPDSLVVCRGDSVTLNPNARKDYRYLWSPAESLNNPNAPNPFAKPDANTVYTVLITDAEGFCRIERQVAVRVASVVDSVTAFAMPDSIFGRGFTQLSATFYENTTYNWTPAEQVTPPDSFNPIATPEVTTTYQVTVRNTDGCTRSATVRVVVVNLPCEPPYIFVPSAFSPNNDGANDVFIVRGNHIDELYLAIFNRWGQRVFESRIPNAGWDGTLNGVLLPPDVYGYYLEARCIDGATFRTQGNVTLLR